MHDVWNKPGPPGTDDPDRVQLRDSGGAVPRRPTLSRVPANVTIESGRASRERALSWIIATQLVGSSSIAFAASDPSLRHWFIIPVSACGVLVGVDAVDWIRKRLDTFAPQALLGVFGFHFLYLAPTLHVAWNYYAKYVGGLADWRDGFGKMALINLAGLILYRGVLAMDRRPQQRNRVREMDERRFQGLGVMAAGLGVLAFVGMVVHFGGPSGYLSVITEARNSLAGFGAVLLVGESFPLVLFTVLLMRGRERMKNNLPLLIVLIVGFTICVFLVAGLRGSRSNTIWPVLIVFAMVHLLVRPLPRRALVSGMIFVLLFMYMYGLYKVHGTAVVAALRDGKIGTVAAETDRGLPDLLLGDLGRADIQALVLHRQYERGLEPAYGQTYLAAAIFPLPSSVAPPDLVKNKVAAGTDVLYGRGTYASGFRSSRIYGLAGEGILNFGAVGGILAFGVLGLIIRETGRLYDAARRETRLPARILAPGLAVAAVLVLGQDADNVVFFLLRHVLPLAVVTALASRIVPAAQEVPAKGRAGHFSD